MLYDDPFLSMKVIHVLESYGHKPDEYEAFAEAVGEPLDTFCKMRVCDLMGDQIKALCIRMWLSADELLGLNGFGEL